MVTFEASAEKNAHAHHNKVGNLFVATWIKKSQACQNNAQKWTYPDKHDTPPRQAEAISKGSGLVQTHDIKLVLVFREASSAKS